MGALRAADLHCDSLRGIGRPCIKGCMREHGFGNGLRCEAVIYLRRNLCGPTPEGLAINGCTLL